MADYAFLHGGGQGGWIWDETIAALQVQTGGSFGRALALDAPGCGAKRGQPTDGLAMHDVAGELIADIEQAGLSDVVLVGHSQAGQALPIMARMRPDLFRRLVYLTCSAPLPGQNVQQMIGSGLHGAKPEEVGWPVDPATTDMGTRFAAMFCNDMDPAQASAFLARAGQDMWPMITYTETEWSYDDLGGIPATFITCLQDMALPVPWQERFAERLKVERIVRLDAGHQAMTTRPHALAELLRLEAEA
jgi:pimeloyl-ACP methyl ester carboxylesterase